MKITQLIALALCLNLSSVQAQIKIETADIDHFWEAFDSLSLAKSTVDSVSIIERLYFGRATEGLKAYRPVRPNTALNHIESIRNYPKYWRSVRPMTARAKQAKPAIDKVFSKYQTFIPHFRPTNVAFVVGCINSAGTISSDWIFIGVDIAAADTTIDKSEMDNKFKDLIGTDDGDLTVIVAHEAIHTQQISIIDPPTEGETLWNSIIDEGIADFIPHLLFKHQLNPRAYEYGYKNECELWQQLTIDLGKNNYKPWLYNGMEIKDRPADLGYFMGFRIAEAFYNKRKNKREAIDILLKSRNYKEIIAQSGYKGGCK
jgi:Predicted Zn-dependent protease (DUF2268)